MATDELQPQQEEKRECIVCGRSLPLSIYWRSKNGARCKTCPDCCRESRTAPSACACHVQGQNAARNIGHYAGW